MAHHSLVTNVDSLRAKQKSSLNWRTGLISAILAASIVCVAYLEIAGVEENSENEPVVFLGSNLNAQLSDGHQTPHAMDSREPQSAAQNTSSKLHLASKLPDKDHKLKFLRIKGFEVRGPFPKIGLHGGVPTMNADIVDSMEDPQVRPITPLSTAEHAPRAADPRPPD